MPCHAWRRTWRASSRSSTPPPPIAPRSPPSSTPRPPRARCCTGIRSRSTGTPCSSAPLRRH
uniref:Uncharacterized protein n=1 Tax=Arundo donax TaxID=35708 RepID=A0A0A9ENK3_ARUDO